MVKKIVKYIKNPLRLVLPLGERGLLNWIPDKIYLRILFYAETGKKLNLKNPITFNDKIQWLKLYNRRSEYSIYADKLEVRNHISKTIGEKYLIPILGVYNSVEEIDWNSLPNKFVLKCTHGSNSNIICTDKKKLDIEESKKKLKKWMKKNWYWFGREWCYKNIKPRIICERYMVDESGLELKDYKIFCFNGVPKLIQVDFNRFNNHKRNLYTTNWEFIDATIKKPNAKEIKIPKPKKLDEMLRLSKILSQNIPHVRVDFYSIDKEIYFGEMTFYHGSGFEKFYPESLGELMGSWIELPNGKS